MCGVTHHALVRLLAEEAVCKFSTEHEAARALDVAQHEQAHQVHQVQPWFLLVFIDVEWCDSCVAHQHHVSAHSLGLHVLTTCLMCFLIQQ